MSDPRRDHLTRCAVESLGASAANGRWSLPAAELTTKLHGDPAMQDFLEQPSVKTLQVSVVQTSNGTNDLACSNTVGFSRPGGAAATAGVVFTKRSSEVLTADNMASAVVMSTLAASPLQTLQLNIRQLYAPMLLQDPQWAGQLDAKTRAPRGASSRPENAGIRGALLWVMLLV